MFVCSHCDSQFPKWVGQCTECGKWGTVHQQEKTESTAPAALRSRAEFLDSAKAVEPHALFGPKAKKQSLNTKRIHTDIEEVDRVLGGGFVEGECVLLGGDPGIGKSTLVAQMAAGILHSAKKDATVLYVSGEESEDQVRLRLDRLGIQDAGLLFLAEQHIEVVCKTAVEQKPALLIIDSIQTVASSATDGEPGSVNQLKACAVRLLECAKSSGIPVLIIGHVTKGGELGGPKTLEHIVDAVLYIEGDRHHQYRLLRAVKNRFGSTSEVGVFEMQELGLQPVKNAAEVFVEERSHASGSVMTSVVEGSRVFFIEVQALVNKTAFGYPQRKSVGFDGNRLNVLIAVLERRLHVALDTHDVYINVVGGVKFTDPALDAAVCAALISAFTNTIVKDNIVIWGEVGLGGEVRSVSRQKEREKEAKRFGFTTVISGPSMKQLAQAIQAAGLSVD